VEFAILGPVEVRLEGRALQLGGRKERALLTILLLHANQVVSRDQIIDALWGENPPRSVHQSLDSYVSRLRKVLGPDRLLRRPPGYVLKVEPGELDLDRFEHLLQAAREASAAGDAARASSALRDTLGIWRGPALADVLYEPFAAPEAERLEERRLEAIEERIDADLAAGHGADLVPELEALVRKHPFRERLLGQLMVALYRAGRQADALAALQAARHRLTTELGLEPGPQVREFERLILTHDPALAPPTASLGTRVRPHRRAVLAVATAVVVGGAATAFALAVRSNSSSPRLDAEVSRLAAVDLSTGKVGAITELGGQPAAVSLGSDSVWVADASGETVSRVDPRSGDVIDRIPVGGEPGSIVDGGGAIWVASTVGGRISRIDPRTATVTQTVPLGGASAASISFGRGGLWVADPTDRALIEIEPQTGSVRRTLTLDLRPTSVAVADGGIWIADHTTNVIEQLDATTGETLATIHVGNGPTSLAVGAGAVWVANSLDATVSRIDTETASVGATIPVGSDPSALAVAGDSVWVANRYSGTVSRIDPAKNRVIATVHVGGTPTGLAADQRHVWVGAGPSTDTHRGGTLRLVATQPFESIDPAFDLTQPLVFTRLAYDTLVTLQAASGPSGLRLVPDLALAIPTPTGGGTTYTFRLRPGIRYSDGRQLKAADFRRGIERLFRVRSGGTTYYAGVVGAPACMRRPQRCDLSGGIRTDNASRTVVFRLRAPDPDFLLKLTVLGFSVPMPAGTPNHGVRSKAIPGNGPYRIVRATESEVGFVRNPYFREWSHAAQPNGNPDAVMWKIVPSRDKGVAAIDHGRADWMLGLIPPAQLSELRLSRPAQLHTSPAFIVEFVSLNAHRPPFDDVRVRRALNYAIDRSKIARMYGGRAVATPLCQPLPPGMPGYRRYCPYTAEPRADRAWRAPDLARARRLVAASGTRAARVEIWGTTDQVGTPRELPAYFAQVLRSLGYRTRLRVVPSAQLTASLRRRIHFSVDGDWAPDYPAPSAYIPGFFGCDGGFSNGYFCEPQLDRRMRRAAALELKDPRRAAALWARIDHEIVDRALWVPTVSLRAPEFVSERVQNYQYNPIWGFIADQVWLP
jgi:YVTN family beta-propeller protein